MAPFAVPGGDAVAVVAKFALDDAPLAVVPAQPMYRSCIEATLRNEVSEVDGVDEKPESPFDFIQTWHSVYGQQCFFVS